MSLVQVKIRRDQDLSYEIRIETGLLEKIPGLLKKKPMGEKYAIITDETVRKLYGETLKKNLEKAKITAHIFSFPQSDRSKTLRTVSALLSQMIQKGFTRKDAVIALGGGVPGDIAGFTASVFMRGIPFIQVPTTLLAMADSSIGGKTGVNLQEGKNMVGTFTQPRAVYIDTKALLTLPEHELRNGMSEVVKAAIIQDKKFFDYLDGKAKKLLQRNSSFLNTIIIQACRIKASVVEKDEMESGMRMILNFGHTLGHAFEKVSRYTIPHGYGVAAGMKLANAIAHKKHLIKENDYLRINNLINQYGLTRDFPLTLTKKGKYQALWNALKHDKKSSSRKVRFVIVPAIGKAAVTDTITQSDVYHALKNYQST